MEITLTKLPKNIYSDSPYTAKLTHNVYIVTELIEHAKLPQNTKL